MDDFWFRNIEEEGIAQTFIKMELCHGTLENHLNGLRSRGEDLAPRELTQIMIHILCGLCHCHERRVVHRDLKLSNGNLVFSSLINFSALCG